MRKETRLPGANRDVTPVAERWPRKLLGMASNHSLNKQDRAWENGEGYSEDSSNRQSLANPNKSWCSELLYAFPSIWPSCLHKSDIALLSEVAQVLIEWLLLSPSLRLSSPSDSPSDLRPCILHQDLTRRSCSRKHWGRYCRDLRERGTRQDLNSNGLQPNSNGPP